MAQTMMQAIQEQDNSRDLWRLVYGYFGDRNIDKMSYHHFTPDLHQNQTTTVRASGFADEWVCHYIKAKLFLIDPITELAATTTTPFLWSDIERLTRVSPEQRSYLNQMRDAGIGDGLAFQVFGPGLRNGYVGLGIPNPKDIPTDAQILEYQLVLQAGHIQFCKLNPLGGEDVQLSPRESEILRWIARGKSNLDIADILQLSRHTVDTLVRRIFEKLHVMDRTSAAVQGVGAGLIMP